MLGALVTCQAQLPWAPSAWKLWVDHILKQNKFDFKKVALLHENGKMAASNKGFLVSKDDILDLAEQFDQEGNPEEKIRLQGKTYIVKKRDSSYIIAFNGNKYLLIAKSTSMYILTVCHSKSHHEEAAQFLCKLSNKLREQKF